MTPTSARTSSQDASRDATGRSSEVSCWSLRDVVKPIRTRAQARRRSSLAMTARSSWACLVGERAFAHRVGAQRRVPDVRRVVDRLRAAVDRVQVLGERRPPPVDPRGHRVAGDVLGPLEVADHERPLLRGAGASVNPQWPMTTVVTPCQHEHVPSASQKTCASMCVWPSMNPGVTTWPSASTSSAPRSRMRPIVAMRSPTMPRSHGRAAARSRRRRFRPGSRGRGA